MHNLGWLGLLVFLGLGAAQLFALGSIAASFVAKSKMTCKRLAGINASVVLLVAVTAVVSLVSECGHASGETLDGLGFILAFAVLPAVATIVCRIRARKLPA